MANKHNGEVAVEIDGKEYKLKLLAEHFATAEGLLGVDSLIGRALGFRSIQALFYLGCEGQHQVTIRKVADMMNTHMQAISSAVNEAVDFFYQNQIELIQN